MTAVTIIAMGAIVFVMRFSFFAMPQNAMPGQVRRGLYYVLPAVLMSLVVPAVLLDAQGDFRPVGNPYLIGAAAGVGVGAWRPKNFFLIFGASVLTFAFAKAILG
jgi:branched-subunit amino acid transport protein